MSDAPAPDARSKDLPALRVRALRTARHLLGDDPAVEDVAQEVLLRLARHRGSLRGEAEATTWLHTVTLNLCRDHLRARVRGRKEVELSEVDASRLGGESSDPERLVDLQRATRAVRAALERLPDDQQELVELRYLDGLSYREIVARTSLPLGTVASRIYRALRHLGRDLEARHMEVLK